jgi:hypothetical protein
MSEKAMREHLRHETFGRPELEAASAAPVATEHAARIVHAGGVGTFAIPAVVSDRLEDVATREVV